MCELDALFIIAKTLTDTHNMKCIILKKHGGLGESLQSRFGAHLEPYEILSYMYEALDDAIVEFNPDKGAASTCWANVTWRYVRREQNRTTTCASVRIPFSNRHRYTQVELELT